MNNTTHSDKAFILSVIALSIFVLVIVLQSILLPTSNEAISEATGTLALISVAVAFIGLIYSLRGIREKNTVKKIIGLVINIGFMLIFIAILAS